MSVTPKNYSILFEPDFTTFKFHGKEEVEFVASNPTDTLVLNVAELKINRCYVITGEKEISATFSIDESKEELNVNIPKKIIGKCRLRIDFTGTLNDKLAGFYRSKYKDQKGRERYLATTQFEATDARRAFPCWDIPSAKAAFDVSVAVPRGTRTISNMPIIGKTRIGDKTIVKFERTPVMSTYLLYLGIGEFEHIREKSKGVEIRIITTKGKRKQGRLAMKFAKQFLEFFSDYFKVRYPLPKLDLIAIPDFAAGAMENWGAITFRETALLFDKKNSSTATKQRIAEVVAHEIAHQWFGNLVTMEWWDDLWLNESFATFMATKAVHSFYPEWDMDDQFLLVSMNEAFGLDALKSSHPIHVKVKNTGEIREIFDDISYDKGGCVLRMIEEYVGAENFRSGLSLYINRYKYKAATTVDLWDAIAAKSKKPVKKIMETWIEQAGYPVITVEKHGSGLKLTQNRFLLHAEGQNIKQTWKIPITLLTQTGPKPEVIDSKTEFIGLNRNNKWVKLNAGQKTLCRVNYSESMLKEIKEMVHSGQLSNTDRWGLQNDLFAFCMSGSVGVRQYIDFISAYLGENSYLVSADITENLYFLYLLFSGERFSKEAENFSKVFYKDQFNRLGWNPKEGEPHTNSLLRGYIISGLGRFGDSDVLKEAKKRFEEFLKDPKSLIPDLRATVYNLVAWQGNDKTYKQLLRLYRKAGTQEEKLRFLGALCSFQAEKLLKKSLEFAMSSEVRSQDLATPIARIASNPHGKHLVWLWIRKNWHELTKRYKGGSPVMGRIISSLEVVADVEKADEIKRFFAKNSLPGTEKKIRQTIERIYINVHLLGKARKEFY